MTKFIQSTHTSIFLRIPSSIWMKSTVVISDILANVGIYSINESKRVRKITTQDEVPYPLR